MSINKLSHLKEWEKIYLEVEKITTKWDDEKSMCFESNSSNSIWVNDDDTFYFPDDLKQLANDGIPKQGEMIEARYKTEWGVLSNWFLVKYICMYEWGVLIDTWTRTHKYDEWRYPIQKTELTLAEVEEKLGIEKGSLIIKD